MGDNDKNQKKSHIIIPTTRKDNEKKRKIENIWSELSGVTTTTTTSNGDVDNHNHNNHENNTEENNDDEQPDKKKMKLNDNDDDDKNNVNINININKIKQQQEQQILESDIPSKEDMKTTAKVLITWRKNLKYFDENLTTSKNKKIVKKLNTSLKKLNMKKAKVEKNFTIMKSIFGENQAKKMLQNSKLIAQNFEKTTKESIKKLRNMGNPTNKIEITETLKFAGRKIEVTQSVDKNSLKAKNVMDAQGKNVKQSGLDQMLQSIQGPQAINTVTMSSMKWDKYKEDNKITDELAAATKDGYLSKKDFLNEVELKEHERQINAKLNAPRKK